jgi:HSP20 family protein
VERTYGAFERSFTLTAPVDPTKVTAKFENGVLTVTLPKSEESRPREIRIES